MARKKVNLQLIANDSARRATFKKRRKGLMKKVSELSTLCGVEACAIVYGPNDPNPEVWSSAEDVQHVLARYRSMPEIEQTKFMMNQEGLLRKKMGKAMEQVRKQQRENRVCEITQLMSETLVGKGLQDLVHDDLCDLGWLLERRLKEIHERKEGLQRVMVPNQHLIPPKTDPAPAQMQVSEQMESKETMQQRQWLMGMMNAHTGGYYSNGNGTGNGFVMPCNNNSAWPGTSFSG
ncbi:hypothetical protein ACHQM5_028726 [Ranunculus cassubicifolius]